MTSLLFQPWHLQTSLRGVVALVSFSMVAATFMLGSMEARSQQPTAKVDQTTKVYCRYRDSKTNKDKTGIVSGLSSCDDGDANILVAYTPCGEPTTQLPRKALKKSEVDCNGAAPVRTDFAVSILGKILEIEGDKLKIEYQTTQGVQVFSASKSAIKGSDPTPNAGIVFTPIDPAKKTSPEALVKAFEKFKIDANRGVFANQEVVGLVKK